MFPVTFGKNLHNYNEFMKYFSLLEWDEIDLNRYTIKQWTWESISSFWWSLKENINMWKSNTYGWFKKPKKR
jgi:hypothetical protein